MFICFTFVKCACFVLYSTCVRFDWVQSPAVTLCGWLGYKPSVNKWISSTSCHMNLFVYRWWWWHLLLQQLQWWRREAEEESKGGGLLLLRWWKEVQAQVRACDSQTQAKGSPTAPPVSRLGHQEEVLHLCSVVDATFYLHVGRCLFSPLQLAMQALENNLTVPLLLCLTPFLWLALPSCVSQYPSSCVWLPSCDWQYPPSCVWHTLMFHSTPPLVCHSPSIPLCIQSCACFLVFRLVKEKFICRNKC